MITWRTICNPFIRVWRWFGYRCVVCGRYVGVRAPDVTEGRNRHYRYCSLECAAYDGALKDQHKSWVLFGTVHDHPKPHYESAMREE